MVGDITSQYCQVSTKEISSLRTESKKSYKPSTSYAVYLSKGLKSIENINEDEKLSVIVRKEQSGDVFNFAHKNFYVITRYNRSRLYALAVHFLSVELREAKSQMERL